MKISEKGINLIKGFETFKAVAYLCPAGVLTIGYGHTGKDVKEGMVITEEEAERLLVDDIILSEEAVRNNVRKSLTQNQYDALVSFVFNVGADGFRKSTLLKLVNIDPADEAIKNEFLRWKYSKGKVLSGLERRRAVEAELYFTK